MSRYLLDTGPAQKFINNDAVIRQAVDERRQKGNTIGICLPVLGELWSGVEGSATPDRNRKVLQHGLSRFVLWPYDKPAAEEFGRLFTALRKMGRPMQQIDIQMAAIALTLTDCTVVTFDSDLSAIPGLSVEDWRGTS
ncbi:MAG: type II toxin-antitoxin system VapC family toxin [Planctomycetota bacterium]